MKTKAALITTKQSKLAKQTAKYIAMLIILATATQLSAQDFVIYKGDTINRRTQKKRTGDWKEFYKDGKLKAEGSYQNARKQGLWLSYYPNGNKQAEITHKQGRKKGYAKTYYKDGTLAEEGIWDSNRWIGSYKAYHTNGKIAYDWQYNQMGKKTGPQKFYYDNGAVLLEGEWSNGKIQGALKDYYPDGKLKSERNFIDGKIDNTQTRYFEPSKEVAIKIEDPNPPVVRKGNDTPEQELPQGIFDRDGFGKIYNVEKQLVREGEFKAGKLHNGRKLIYDDNGKHIKNIIYENGKAVRVEDANAQSTTP